MWSDSRTIELWTWQHPDWDMTSQEWSPDFGAQAWGHDEFNVLKRLYAEMRSRLALGARHVIWCNIVYQYWSRADIRRLWQLNVPSEEIVLYLDGNAWEELRRSKFTTLEEGESAWARLRIPDVDPWLQKRRESSDYAGQHPNRRHQLIQGDVQALIAVPIHSEWVKDKSRCSTGNVGRERRKDDLPCCGD